jgi:hypothetical protein
MHQAGTDIYGLRMRALIAVLWRAGMRIHEALLLTESDLDHATGSLLVRRGKGGKRRIVGMDDWGWRTSTPGSSAAARSPTARCSASSTDPTAGRPWDQHAVRGKLRTLATPPASAAASLRTSCATRSPSRSTARASA